MILNVRCGGLIIKTFAVRIYSLVIPAFALIAFVVNGIFVTQMRAIVYWLITVSIFVALLSWQRHLRITYYESHDAEMCTDQIASLRPYAITYGILYAGLFAGFVCVAYFGRGLPFFIACFAAWLIRRDVWLALHLRGLNKSG